MISCGSIVLTPMFLVVAFSFRHFVEIPRNSRLAMYFGDLYPSSQRISDKAVVTLVSGITHKHSVVVSGARLRSHWRHVTYENKVQHDLLCCVSFHHQKMAASSIASRIEKYQGRKSATRKSQKYSETNI